MPGHIERLAWDAGRLRDHQNRALTLLLQTAISRSPFHRRRLHGIDPGSITPDRLVDLPVMTKAEMMDDLDEVLTDRRLNRSLIERHLAEVGAEPELLLDEYLALTSGGSSGTRGVFVMSREDAIDFAACCIRPAFAKLIPAIGWPPARRIPLAFVTAPKPLHATRALPPLLAAVADISYAPATLLIDDVIERLERAQPMIVMSYPSILARLGDAAAAGRLRIAPKIILATSEQLQADHVARIAARAGHEPHQSRPAPDSLPARRRDDGASRCRPRPSARHRQRPQRRFARDRRCHRASAHRALDVAQAPGDQRVPGPGREP
jgi:phenylacetate-coenzyme A ligase PaaK-like adenylate-forming protein